MRPAPTTINHAEPSFEKENQCINGTILHNRQKPALTFDRETCYFTLTMGKKLLQYLALASLWHAPWPTSSAQAQTPVVAAESLPGPRITDARPCVLLENDNVLFGRAYQVGEFVVVQTGAGGEVRLSRKEVVCWAGSTGDLYRYRVDHRQQGDVAAHVRDAKWCLRYDLLDLAAEEIRTIKTMDPRNAQAKLIEDQLRRLMSPTAAEDSGVTATPVEVQRASFEDSGADLGSSDLITLGGFARHVQPMLISHCGRCHAHDSGRQWTLLLPPSGARASSRMTRENLFASLRYVDRDAPDESELLAKATTAHGGGPIPLDPRSAKAIQSFKTWLAEASTTGQTSPANQDASVEQVSAQTTSIQEHPAVADDASGSNDRSGLPARLPWVNNPFDPDLFNRRFHPK